MGEAMRSDHLWCLNVTLWMKLKPSQQHTDFPVFCRYLDINSGLPSHHCWIILVDLLRRMGFVPLEAIIRRISPVVYVNRELSDFVVEYSRFNRRQLRQMHDTCNRRNVPLWEGYIFPLTWYRSDEIGFTHAVFLIKPWMPQQTEEMSWMFCLRSRMGGSKTIPRSNRLNFIIFFFRKEKNANIVGLLVYSCVNLLRFFFIFKYCVIWAKRVKYE